MAIEAIKQIKTAEDEATNIVKAAYQKSKEIIKDAEVYARENYKLKIEEASIKGKEIVGTAICEVQNEINPIIESGKKEIDAILNVSEEKLDIAVNLVIERIVSQYGNS